MVPFEHRGGISRYRGRDAWDTAEETGDDALGKIGAEGATRAVYEAAWGVPLDPRNFSRKVLSAPGFVVEDGKAKWVDPFDADEPLPDLSRAIDSLPAWLTTTSKKRTPASWQSTLIVA